MVLARVQGWLRPLVHVGALWPLVSLWLDWQAGRMALLVNPIQDLTQRTGKTALVLLVLSLTVTPAGTLLGWRKLQPHRRTLGLYAFFYAALHLSIFFVLDYGLDPELLREAVLEKPYALVGLTAFLLLLPLAITSTKGWMRRLGKRWKQLHKLVYPTALLVVLHYTWSVKADVREPLAWGAFILLLLALRLPRVRRRVSTWRSSRRAVSTA